jgi:hypothetical protein
MVLAELSHAYCADYRRAPGSVGESVHTGYPGRILETVLAPVSSRATERAAKAQFSRSGARLVLRAVEDRKCALLQCRFIAIHHK